MLVQLDILMLRLSLDLYLLPYSKFNSKWIIYLNVRVKTIKILEKNIELNLHDYVWSNDLLHMTTEAKTIKKETRHH